MTAQLTIAEAVDVPDRWTIACREWLKANPTVLDDIVAELRRIRDAHECQGLPVPTVSVRDVFALLRIRRLRLARDVAGFTLNNSFTAVLAREIQMHHEDVADMVATRTRQVDAA